jgi:hypothetical protein
MLTLAWKILVAEVMRAWQRARGHWGEMLLLLLPPGVRQLRCARRIYALAIRLESMRCKIMAFEASIVGGAFKDAVDADFTIRAMLSGLKEDIREIRCEMAAVPDGARTGPGGEHLSKAIARLYSVAQATYIAADRLLWEIGEHDRKYLS